MPIGRSARSNVVSTEDPFLCGLAGYAIARRLDLPLSLQFAGDMIDNPIWMSERPLNRWLNPLGKWLIRHAQTFRVVSTREREKLIGLGVDRPTRGEHWLDHRLPALSRCGRFGNSRAMAQ